jgi:DNA-binding transcriptional LysR family regulator
VFYHITFQQLATFFAVAERLNVTETADALYISQSALSKTISRLEASMGLKLFDRNNRGLNLTAEGAFLLNKLRPLYNGMCGHIEQPGPGKARGKKQYASGIPVLMTQAKTMIK